MVTICARLFLRNLLRLILRRLYCINIRNSCCNIWRYIRRCTRSLIGSLAGCLTWNIFTVIISKDLVRDINALSISFFTAGITRNCESAFILGIAVLTLPSKIRILHLFWFIWIIIWVKFRKLISFFNFFDFFRT